MLRKQNEKVDSQMSGTYIPLRAPWTITSFRQTGLCILRFFLACAPGIVCVTLVAVLAHWTKWLLPGAILLYLLVVLPTAFLWGFWQAVTVTLSAFAVHGSLSVRPPILAVWADPLSLGTLIVFLLIAFVAARVSARQTQRVEETQSWVKQMRDVDRLSQRTLEMNLHLVPGPQLAKLIHEVFALQAVVVFDADLHDVYQEGTWSVDPQDLARNVYYFEKSDDDPVRGIGRRVVRLGPIPIGSFIVHGNTSPHTNNAIASLIAISFDRYRAFANESHIEAEHRTEQLRTAVLDSLAHAYKTPLTAIRAASTGLAEMGQLSEAQLDLVSLIDEQADLLGELTTRLLTTARLDAEDIAVHLSPVGMTGLLEEVVLSLKERLSNSRVSMKVEPDDLMLNCDRQLMVALLTQYIDNACKYSIFGTAISICIALNEDEVIFSVHSWGPVISLADRERIFDRYYRAAGTSSSASGTGIGLSIAKRIARIHGGFVWVTSEEAEGTTFFGSIPTKAVQKGVR